MPERPWVVMAIRSGCVLSAAARTASAGGDVTTSASTSLPVAEVRRAWSSRRYDSASCRSPLRSRSVWVPQSRGLSTAASRSTLAFVAVAMRSTYGSMASAASEPSSGTSILPIMIFLPPLHPVRLHRSLPAKIIYVRAPGHELGDLSRAIMAAGDRDKSLRAGSSFFPGFVTAYCPGDQGTDVPCGALGACFSAGRLRTEWPLFRCAGAGYFGSRKEKGGTRNEAVQSSKALVLVGAPGFGDSLHRRWSVHGERGPLGKGRGEGCDRPREYSDF